ncbi:MAG: cation:proton antiporter [Campylobacterota bacterium]|nr:cation:proton antiporter [Campylobacterota bacterium]
MLELIVYTLLISLVINIIMKKFQLPTIIGYIITGTIIAYTFHYHNTLHSDELKEIAEFGVVFLMFTIGLELSFSHLKHLRNEVFIAGSAQILMTATVVYLLAFYLIGLDQKVSAVIALAIALSSTAIVLKTFNDTGEINRRYGQRSLGILIMQDIAVIPILLFLSFLTTEGTSVVDVILETIIDGVILVTLLVLIGKYLLNPFFTQITKTHSDELFVGSILFIAIGSSFLAHELGFSYSLGAFIAGMLISETRFKYQAEADLIPFRDLLLGIFFISVGMQINFEIIFEHLGTIVVLLIAILILKFLIIYAVIRINENRRTSIITALSLIQVGEFSLAILELARSNSLIGPPYGQIMIVTIVISMVMTPIILKNLNKIADKCKQDDESSEEKVYQSIDDLKGHVVIIGYGEFGREVSKALREVGTPYMFLENNIHRFNNAITNNELAVYGNAIRKEVLKSTYLKEAEYIIVGIDDPHKLRQACESINKIFDKTRIIVKVHSSREKKYIEDMNLGYIIIENDLIGKSVAGIVTDQTHLELHSI